MQFLSRIPLLTVMEKTWSFLNRQDTFLQYTEFWRKKYAKGKFWVLLESPGTFLIRGHLQITICCSKFTLQINKQRVQGLQQATQNYLQVSLTHELHMSFYFISCTQSQCSLPENSLRSERILIHLLTKDPGELNASLCTKEQTASELHRSNAFCFSYPKAAPLVWAFGRHSSS